MSMPDQPTTMCAALHRTVAARPTEIAVRTDFGGPSCTWAEYAERVAAVATALAGAGVQHGEPVALMLTDRPEFHFADTAAHGRPKGVEITHGNMVAMVAATAPLVGIVPGDRLSSFRPAAHIADRWASHHLNLWAGTEVTCLADLRQLPAALLEVRPTLFGGVPQVWQRIVGGLRRLPDPAIRGAVEQAVQIGLRHQQAVLAGEVPDELALRTRFPRRPMRRCRVPSRSAATGCCPRAGRRVATWSPPP